MSTNYTEGRAKGYSNILVFLLFENILGREIQGPNPFIAGDPMS